MYQFFARVNGSPSLNHQININNNQKSTLLSADVEYENSNDENENPNRPKTGATKLEFIQDSTVSANRKKKRKTGLIKKMTEFDTMTGSQSIFISLGLNEEKSDVREKKLK
jgi:hypothetical protein